MHDEFLNSLYKGMNTILKEKTTIIVIISVLLLLTFVYRFDQILIMYYAN